MDYVLFFTVLILCAVGVITVYSASTPAALQQHLPADHFAVRQLAAAALGLTACLVISRLSYAWWYRLAPLLLLAGLLLLLVVLVPGIGWSQYGGRRWIGHGNIHLQPSELAMVSTLLYLAFFFAKKSMLRNDFKRGVLPAVLVAALNFGLVVLEPDMGTALTLLAAAVAVLFASGVRLKPLLLLGAGCAPILMFIALAASYRSSRIEAWLHPFQNSSDKAYQLLQGLTAIAAGGWFGRGFGMSLEKTGYLPFAYTDFIFPVFVEEWGLVGAATLLLAFAVVFWRGFRIARRAPDRFGTLLCVGLTSLLALKTLINLGAVTGLLPVTGIPLPFISFGGTSLAVNLAAVGLLLSVSRYTREDNVDNAQDEPLSDLADGNLVLLPSPGKPPLAALPGAPRPQPARPRRADASTEPVHLASWRNRPSTKPAANARPSPRAAEPNRSRPPVPPARTWQARNSRLQGNAGGGKNPRRPDRPGGSKPRRRGWRRDT
ncbi:MAG: putative lipid II flippase FtsW, partial [Alicyclobacillus sp.]|nr:putative lipid II flippase FtsW [Alicyclobacillus sp.]